MTRRPVLAAALGVAGLALAASAAARGAGVEAESASVAMQGSDADLYDARCGGCHSIDGNRVGPRHRGVIGRRAGSVEGFTYSEALGRAGFTWTPEQLDRWLQNPGALVPGTTMGFRLADASERQRIIAYLTTQMMQVTGGQL